MSFYNTRLEQDAREAAKISSYDEARSRAFVEGAKWTAACLLSAMDVHPMEDPGTEKWLDGMRLKDVRELLHTLIYGSKP